MKKKSASRSAFFNPRFLTGFAFCVFGVFLALMAFAASNQSAAPVQAADASALVRDSAPDSSVTQAPYIAPAVVLTPNGASSQTAAIGAEQPDQNPCNIVNGGLNPQATSESGVAAPAGFFWSEVQHDTGNTTQANTNAGYADTQGTLRLADNFTLTQPCTINSVVFYGYLTGAPGSPSPFTGYTLQIHNGRPGDPGELVVFGDTTTNRLASSVDSTYFRIFNSSVPPPGTATGTTRKIWKNTVTVGMTLPAGTYWVDWASTVTGAANHFAPSKTIPGSRGAAGDNARQFTAGAWVDVTDVGLPASGTPVPQDFPFEVNGTATGVSPTPGVTPSPSVAPSATPTPPPPSPTPSVAASATPCGSATTFSNPAAITINDAGVAAPYPSNITVSGVTGPVTKVTATITGFNHTFPSDVDILLVGPGGQKFILVSDVIGGTDAVGVNWTFDDTAAAFIGSTGTPASGTFKPTNYTTCQDPFAAPAPAGPYLSPGGIGTPCGTDTLAAFNGVDPNGTWSLYVVDDLGADVGNITGGWSLTITGSGAGCPSPTPGITPTPSPVASCTPGAWTAVASFPAPDVYGAAATSNGTSAWLAGGYSFSAADDQAVFRRYDLGSNTWTTLTPMPDAVSNASAVYSPINNKVYVFGGGNVTAATVSNATRIYDVAAGTWSAGTNMPDVRGFMASGYFNGKIYLVGGYSTGNISPAFGQVWEYDPIANTFNTTRLDMPATLGGAGSAILNGHLYVAGGRDATNTVVASLYDYDIAANTWTTRANMPSANNVPGSGVLNGQLWVYGGGNPFNASGKNTPAMNAPKTDALDTTNGSVIYDPGSNSWTAGPSLTEARSFVAGTNIGNTLFAAGGYNGTTTVMTTETLSGAGCPSPTPGITPTPSATVSCPASITESSTQTITPLNSVSCNNGTGHTDNSYWRAFTMNSFVGSNAYNVTSVSFGIEQATGAGGTQPITVRLHTSNQPFPTGFPASLTQIATATVNVPDTASNTVFTVPIAATVPANAELVMELFTPDGTVAGNLFFVGSNADPETGPSYLSAAACGITTPTTTSAIGFPNMHIVFNVNGSCGTPVSPTPGVTPSPGITPTPSPSTTPCSGGSDVIVDGGFENGGIPSSTWDPETSTNFGTPLCDFASCGNGGGASPPRTGLIWAWFGGIAAPETATLGQTVTIPSGGPATLHFWMRIGTVTTPFTDVLNVRVDGTIVQSYPEPAVAETDYAERVLDLSAFANGASHALLFEYIGPSTDTGSYVIDDVSLIAGGACASPSPGTTPIPTATPSASPVCSPTWLAGPNFPAVGAVRAPGNFFPANGRFYSIGGRNADVAGADFANPFEYDPATNAWTTKPSTIPDGLVNNMACGVLTVSGTPQIYCVGGSQSQVVGTTGRVFSYNPATDTFTTLTGDEWPGSQTNTFLPGGFAVAGNKLYIIGSFNANAVPPVMTNQTWQFDPTAAVGSKWLARANYPQARGYVPAAAIGGLIYTGGGSALDPTGALIDSVESYTYNPATDAWTAIANIPRSTGETRAVVMGTQMWVLGGGRTAPNPSNQVNIYDTGSNTWSLGTPFSVARRNFPADSNGTDRIFLAGGYDSSGTVLLNTMEIFAPGSCASPSPTPPATPSPSIPPTTPTPTPPEGTPTPTPPEGTPTPTPPTTPSPTPGVSPAAQAVNFSTRMHVEGGDKVGIGGFIVSGAVPKRLIVRAIGPSLTRNGFIDVLADPVLELHGPTGFVTIVNDNWRDTQEAEIQATGLPPTNNLESAIVATLAPGNYTAIVRANGPTELARTGLALVEVYDLAQDLGKLGNISTRAFCGTDDNIIIAGFILGNNGGDDNVIARGIGPSLASQGVPTPLANPTLQLRDSNGALLSSNNDWQDNPAQAAIISAAGLAPGDDLESAIAATLPPGAYTALLAGLNNGTGIGLVEVYDRGDGSGGPPIPTPTPGITPVPTPSPSPGVPTPTPSAPPATPTPPPASPTPSPTTCTENFEEVTPPALPPGWTQAIVAGPPPTWTTSTGDPDASVNNAFIIDTSVVSDKVLDRAGVAINSSSPVLSFRNNFDLEASDAFYDGGVLEVASPNINGGAFTDVTNALVGGSFISGEYTGTIDTTAGSPIAGQEAWSGSSGGYIDSVINLGPNLNGQTVTLRWRCATDEASVATGWRFDTVVVTGASCP